ncbi:MAG: phosphatidate cytidylyltransferase, partial [bacterium]|nr:phosphatidate cytidylyltransferase [bacterium]
LGSWSFAVLIALIAAMAMFEYMTILRHSGAEVVRTSSAILSAAVVLLVWIDFHLGFHLGLFVVLLLALFSLRGSGQNMSLRAAGSIGGFVYIVGFLSTLVILRKLLLPDATWEGGIFTLYLMSLIWVCDTFAYLGGKKMGKRPLAPEISPKKTVEGAIFGLFGAMLWSLTGVLLLSEFLPWEFLVATAFVAGTIGQAGDLLESMFKRSAGVKDSGKLLPEHGGVFDRFDSLILTSPAVYLLAVAFGLIKF